MAASDADRNLLYGVLALQMGLVQRDGLIAALHAWIRSKAKPLSQILQEQRALGRSDHPAVEYAVRRHLERNAYDATHCLTALDVELEGSVRELLRSVDDSEVRRTLYDVEAEQSSRAQTEPGETAASAQSADADVIDLRELLEQSAKQSAPRYRPLRLHARGGLGEVYVAHDQEIGREVALKEIRAEYVHDAKLRERFVREAEVNGNLEHPGIVPIYGLGEYPDGRPYYAMRFVEGANLLEPIARLHDESRPLAPAARDAELRRLLRSLVTVCHAIAYAHSRGVLHRDLKPANILLGTYGETVIIDWGLAKLLDQPDVASSRVGDADPVQLLSSESSVRSTVPGETLGSPQYMSPEQARGEHETLLPASDIYSLGATLYAVLTGRPPVSERTVKETVNKVSRGEFDPPCAVRAGVPKPLEAICLNAMRFKPEERYATALAMANDIEAWMADAPVGVYRDPMRARLLRWARHHQALVAAGLTLMVVGLAGLSIATAVVSAQKREVERARDREGVARTVAENARIDENKARIQASNQLRVGLGVLERLVTFGDRQMIARQPLAERRRFLEAASEFVRGFSEERSGDGQMRARAALLATRLANLDRLSGDYARADVLYGDAEGILAQLCADETAPAELRDQYAEVLLERGQADFERARGAEAERAFEEAAKLAEANRRGNPGSLPFQRTLGKTYYHRGAARLARGADGAVDLLRAAIETLKPVADKTLSELAPGPERDDPLPVYDQLQLAAAYSQLGTGLRHAGSIDDAEAAHRAALARLDDLTRRLGEPARDDLKLYRGVVLVRLAETSLEQPGGHAAAADLLSPAVDALAEVATAMPDAPRYLDFWADALATRARLWHRAGQADAAWQDAEVARTLIEPRLGPSPTPELRGLMGQILLVQGDLAHGRAAASETPRSLYERARAEFDAALQVLPKNPDLLKGRAACQARLEGP